MGKCSLVNCGFHFKAMLANNFLAIKDFKGNIKLSESDKLAVFIPDLQYLIDGEKNTFAVVV